MPDRNDGTKAQAQEPGMPMWKRFWILFTGIWLLVSLMSVATVLAFGERMTLEGVLQLLAVAILPPAVLYAAGSLRDWLRRR